MRGKTLNKQSNRKRQRNQNHQPSGLKRKTGERGQNVTERVGLHMTPRDEREEELWRMYV